MIDGYEEYGQARTADTSKKNDTSQAQVPQGFTPHSLCPGSLVTHCGALKTLNMVARSPCSFLVQLSCRLVYALMRANPLNVIVLEAFDVIQGLYGSLAGLVAKCNKLQQKNEKILMKKNRTNSHSVKSGKYKSETASNLPFSSSNNNTPHFPTEHIVNSNAISDPILQSNPTSTSTPTSTPNSNSKKKKKMDVSSNLETNTNMNTKTKTEVKEVKEVVKNEDDTHDLHAGCTDLVPVVFDLTCVLQYVAVVTSERGDVFLRFLLHLAVSMSITLHTTSSSPSSSSSSSSSSSVSFNQATGRNRIDNKRSNKKIQEKIRMNSDISADKNTNSKTVIIDPGPAPLSDSFSLALQLYPSLRSYQYSQYVTDSDRVKREIDTKREEERQGAIEVETKIETGTKKKMTVNSDENEKEKVRSKDKDRKGENSEVEVENVCDTAGDSDVVEKDKEEEEVEGEVEESHNEEVFCVLLFALKGSVDDTIVSTARPLRFSLFLLPC